MYNKMDDSYKPIMEVKEVHIKYILYDFIHIKFKNRQTNRL